MKKKKVEDFAKKLPIFKNIIIQQELTGEEKEVCFGRKYKEMPLEPGIYRVFFSSDNKGRCMVGNYGHYNLYCFQISINIPVLFGLKFKNAFLKLHENLKNCVVYFEDTVNDVFYVEDEHIEDFLKSLRSWYNSVVK
jgi:hypothetical protein